MCRYVSICGSSVGNGMCTVCVRYVYGLCTHTVAPPLLSAARLGSRSQRLRVRFPVGEDLGLHVATLWEPFGGFCARSCARCFSQTAKGAGVDTQHRPPSAIHLCPSVGATGHHGGNNTGEAKGGGGARGQWPWGGGTHGRVGRGRFEVPGGRFRIPCQPLM
jgi:hypothetical protein